MGTFKMSSLLLLFCCAATGAFAQFSTNEDFTVISYNGIEIMKHADDMPLLAVGYGTFDAIENQGNFNVTDDISEIERFYPSNSSSEGE